MNKHRDKDIDIGKIKKQIMKSYIQDKKVKK